MPDIIKELGLEDLTEKDRQDVILQVADSLLKRILLRVHDQLSEDDRKEFEKLAEIGDPVKIEKFLLAKIPDLDELRNEELDNLLKEMKDFVGAAKK